MKMTIHEKLEKINVIEEKAVYLTKHTSMKWSVDLGRKCWNTEYKGMGIKVYDSGKQSKIGIGEEEYKVDHFEDLSVLLRERYPMKEVPSDEFFNRAFLLLGMDNWSK